MPGHRAPCRAKPGLFAKTVVPLQGEQRYQGGGCGGSPSGARASLRLERGGQVHSRPFVISRCLCNAAPQRARPEPPSDAPLSPPPFPAPWSRGPAHQPCALRSQPRELPLQAGLLVCGVWSRGASLSAPCAPPPARSALAAAASPWAGPPGSTDCLPLSCASTADPLL